jgi:hypothetical protein
MMLDGRCFLALPVETAGRQLLCLLVAGSQALQPRPGAPTGFSSKPMLGSCDGMGRPVAIAALMNNLDKLCESAGVVWTFRFECQY